MRPLSIFLLAIALQASVSVTTITDIAGDGAVHQIASSGTARWIQFQALHSNSTATCGSSAVSGCVRIGDSSISATRGTYLVPGGTAFYPFAPADTREADVDRKYQLSAIYYLVQSGDKVSITYAP